MWVTAFHISAKQSVWFEKKKHLTRNIDFEGFLTVSATIFSKEEFEYSQPPQYPRFQTILFSHWYWSFAAKPRQQGAECQETGALSNRKHGLFHIRYFENGPLEPGYLHKRPPLHNSHLTSHSPYIDSSLTLSTTASETTAHPQLPK